MGAYVLMGMSKSRMRFRPWVKYVGLAAIIGVALVSWKPWSKKPQIASVTKEERATQPMETDEPQKPEPIPIKATKTAAVPPPAAETQQEPRKTPPPSSKETPTVVNNAPGGIANSGTIGQATVNNFAPVERHLTQEQAAEFDAMAAALPDSMASHLTVETTNDVESTNFAGEILQILSKRNKVRNNNNLITRMVERPPIPKGVIVIIGSKDDPNFESAQKIANALAKIAPTQFMPATDLPVGDLKIIVFRQ